SIPCSASDNHRRHNGPNPRSVGSLLDADHPRSGVLIASRSTESVWCDSNAGACYIVTVRPGLWAPDLRWAIADAVMEAGGGHNGIRVEADGGNGCDIDPDWGEPF
ncbi:hypothetical protein, partial [Paracoccus limosus]|uniref:hypothetical protein n=1 Tax=Paracoccus limosus TaxID=913252 RepID=UPI001B85E376